MARIGLDWRALGVGLRFDSEGSTHSKRVSFLAGVPERKYLAAGWLRIEVERASPRLYLRLYVATWQPFLQPLQQEAAYSLRLAALSRRPRDCVWQLNGCTALLGPLSPAAQWLGLTARCLQQPTGFARLVAARCSIPAALSCMCAVPRSPAAAPPLSS